MKRNTINKYTHRRRSDGKVASIKQIEIVSSSRNRGSFEKIVHFRAKQQKNEKTPTIASSEWSPMNVDHLKVSKAIMTTKRKENPISHSSLHQAGPDSKTRCKKTCQEPFECRRSKQSPKTSEEEEMIGCSLFYTAGRGGGGVGGRGRDLALNRDVALVVDQQQRTSQRNVLGERDRKKNGKDKKHLKNKTFQSRNITIIATKPLAFDVSESTMVE
jgi:hypothetical protein